jgi:5-formyltetrahydrofolate cyclo-ligase
MSAILPTKADLRAQMRANLGRISPAVRAVESIELCNRLRMQLQSAHTILFYAPLPEELDIWPVLEELVAGRSGIRKNVGLPYYDPETQIYTARLVQDMATDVVTGRYNVREPAADCIPIPLNKFDLVLVPGLAFDLSGNRLGRGMGFYDRLLAETSGIKCGVAYDGQLLEAIPTEPHDARVNFILTPTRCVRGKAKG